KAGTAGPGPARSHGHDQLTVTLISAGAHIEHTRHPAGRGCPCTARAKVRTRASVPLRASWQARTRDCGGNRSTAWQPRAPGSQPGTRRQPQAYAHGCADSLPAVEPTGTAYTRGEGRPPSVRVERSVPDPLSSTDHTVNSSSPDHLDRPPTPTLRDHGYDPRIAHLTLGMLPPLASGFEGGDLQEGSRPRGVNQQVVQVSRQEQICATKSAGSERLALPPVE